MPVLQTQDRLTMAWACRIAAAATLFVLRYKTDHVSFLCTLYPHEEKANNPSPWLRRASVLTGIWSIHCEKMSQSNQKFSNHIQLMDTGSPLLPSTKKAGYWALIAFRRAAASYMYACKGTTCNNSCNCLMQQNEPPWPNIPQWKQFPQNKIHEMY